MVPLARIKMKKVDNLKQEKSKNCQYFEHDSRRQFFSILDAVAVQPPDEIEIAQKGGNHADQ